MASKLGKFEGSDVHDLTLKVKGDMPYDEIPKEGTEIVVVGRGHTGPARFKRDKDGFLIREQDLVLEVTATVASGDHNRLMEYLKSIQQERTGENTLPIGNFTGDDDDPADGG